MREKEALEIVAMIASYFPQYFAEETARAWARELRDCRERAEDVVEGVRHLARTHVGSLMLGHVFKAAADARVARLTREDTEHDRRELGERGSPDPLWRQASEESAMWMCREFAARRPVTEPQFRARVRERYDELRRGKAG